MSRSMGREAPSVPSPDGQTGESPTARNGEKRIATVVEHYRKALTVTLATEVGRGLALLAQPFPQNDGDGPRVRK